ncbi:siroheme synthase [bacterium BMS3Abin07]|nr:siroheme synthase [bacterium BMS3Abin07]GBE33025.1 siroheme synthase [bacterium BMS3Bbin05]HDL20750.1 bifunctional precorrin-2 dehydrogenase/sirohydrochlorin ferrochelatase [Nitrospirota bacterium]HDO22649.1 bifunctional precorrin-2 dehydrogenase/sirohydrochlorin ferrochelatase [Nitrospirota bacterium]HDZ87879.1 bifunctional precorrin-2 dehydrogenase/sirohydrochlorin ferrochelatase [Nitrospirota bacterium]
MNNRPYDNFYPVFLNLKDRKCVVIGGGKVAGRKVLGLLNAGADVTVVSPAITERLEKLVFSGKVRYRARKYRKSDLGGAFLVIAATSDENINRKIYNAAECLVNTVDMPQYCSFIVPSVVRKGPLKIAISSSGLSPAISRTLRKELEDFIPDDLSMYLSYLREVRQKTKELIPGNTKTAASKRSGLLKKLGGRDVLDLLKKGGFVDTKKHIDTILRKEFGKGYSV